MKKSLTIRLWQDSEIDPDFLRRAPCAVRHRGAAGGHGLRRIGAGYAGRPQNGAVPHHVRHRRHVQLPNLHVLHAAFQPALRQGRRCVRRKAAGTRSLPD